jgi:hypothetical protein
MVYSFWSAIYLFNKRLLRPVDCVAQSRATHSAADSSSVARMIPSTEASAAGRKTAMSSAGFRHFEIGTAANLGLGRIESSVPAFTLFIPDSLRDWVPLYPRR